MHMQQVQDSPFYAPCELVYAANNTPDPTKTVVIKWSNLQQTVTFNSDGQPLKATVVTQV